MKNEEEEEDLELRMRMKERDTKKDKDGEIKSENTESWQLGWMFCVHKVLPVVHEIQKENQCQTKSKLCVEHKLKLNCPIILLRTKRSKSNKDHCPSLK